MKEKWFFEKALPNVPQNHRVGFRVKKRIFSRKDKYQDIEILDTFEMGRIFVLDGIVQLSENYEFIYHEMMSHLCLFSHPNPKNVLIIGGGDGGILREVLKHPVKRVDFVELDKTVVDVSKKYFPFLKIENSLKDKRVKLFFDDGAKFIKKKKNCYDAIIVDSTDPSEMSKVLFFKIFYQAIYSSLSAGGVFMTQSGNFIEQIPEIKRTNKKLKSIFPFVKVHRATVFDYELTEFSFILAAKNQNLKKFNPEDIERRFKSLKKCRDLKYYSPQIHFCSGVLPKFYQQKIK